MHRSSTICNGKTVNSSEQTCQLILMWEDNMGWTLLEEALQWIMDSYLVRSDGFKLKRLNHGFVFICDVCFFPSCLDSHSDGTHSLQSIHVWAIDVMLNFSTTVQWRRKFIYILDGLRVSNKWSANFHSSELFLLLEAAYWIKLRN